MGEDEGGRGRGGELDEAGEELTSSSHGLRSASMSRSYPNISKEAG